MKTIFENKFVYDKEFYNEYYKYLYFKRTGVRVFDIILIINLLISIISIIIPNLFEINFYRAITNIVVVLLFLLIQIGGFFENKNIRYKQDLEANNGKPIEVEFLITKERISSDDINISFTNIKKIVRTKKFYFLITKQQNCIILKKDGFTKGTEHEFEEFLRGKRLNCNGRIEILKN